MTTNKFGRYSYFALLFILIIVAIDLSLRLLVTDFKLPLNCFQKDNVQGFIHTPNSTCQFQTNSWDITYQINSQSLRDSEYSLTKDPSTFRIIIIGDSLTEGVGVEIEETFPKQLELLLNENVEQNIEVLNGGVAAYSPTLEYLFLKNKLLEYNPDLVILAFEPLDVIEEVTYQNATTFSLTGEPISILPYFPPHVVNYLISLDASKQSPFNPIQKSDSIVDKLKVVSPLARRIFVDKNQNDAVFEEIFSPDEEAKNLTKKSLNNVNNLLSENQIDFQILSIPHKEQLENNLFESEKFIVNFTGQEAIELIDLTEDFQNVELEDFYIENDVHFNKNGHEFIAQKLNLYLTSSLPVFPPEQSYN